MENRHKGGTETWRKYQEKSDFHSPIKVDIPNGMHCPTITKPVTTSPKTSGVFDKKVSVFARKAGYHYGWDWGPRLVTSGIWRPVYIEAWDDARLSDVFIRQQEVSKTVHPSWEK